MNVHPLGPFGAYTSPAAEIAVLVAVALVVLLFPRLRVVGLVDAWVARAERHPRWFLAGVLFVVFALTMFCAVSVLQCFPNSADEYGYVFLAQTLSAGRWWNELHPLQEFFSFVHIAEKDGRWVSRFLPGWPIVLAATSRIGLAGCWVNPILGACSLAVFHGVARRVSGIRVAMLSTIVFAFSGYFMFTSASFRSHTFESLLLLCFVISLIRATSRGSATDGLLAGGFLGLALVTRPFTAMLFGLCVIPWYVANLATRRKVGLSHLVLGMLPALILLAYYNLQTTGDPLQMVTTWMDPAEGIGFVKGHTPWIAIEHAVRRLASLLEWSSPALLPIFVLSVASFRSREFTSQSSILPYLALTFPVFVMGHMLYFAFGGTQYGPRFYYEAFPFVVLVAVDYAFGGEMGAVDRLRSVSRLGLVAGCAFALVSLPFMAARQHAVVVERQDVFTAVKAKGIERAIVLVASPTSTLWPMGVGDLLRNGTSIDGDVIFARDLGQKTSRLLEAFPDREFFRYVRDPENARGRLVVVRATGGSH